MMKPSLRFASYPNILLRVVPIALMIVLNVQASAEGQERRTDAAIRRATVSPGAQKVRPSPEESALHIKQVAEAEGRKYVMWGPLFVINNQQRNIVYTFGTISMDGVGLPDKSLYRLFFQEQFQIEAIGKVFNQSPEGHLMFKPFRKRAEALIHQTLVDLQSPSDRPRLQALYAAHSAQFAQAIEALEGDILALAAAKGFTAVKMLQSGIIFAIRPWQVHIECDPPGGTVRVMSYFAYRQYEALGGALEDFGLRLISPQEAFIGDYYYIVRWPDGKTGEGRIEFTRPGDYTISAN